MRGKPRRTRSTRSGLEMKRLADTALVSTLNGDQSSKGNLPSVTDEIDVSSGVCEQSGGGLGEVAATR